MLPGTQRYPNTQRSTERPHQSPQPNPGPKCHPTVLGAIPRFCAVQPAFKSTFPTAKGSCLLCRALKIGQLIPRGGPISRGAGHLLTASLKINTNDRLAATLQIRPLSNPSAFPPFYVLHITGLSNHVGIDYYCYYLLNSYFLLLG